MAGVSTSTSNESTQQTIRHLLRPSPISGLQTLAGQKGQGTSNKSLVQALQLTSLIDAFAIIVIYLLIGTQSGGFDVKLSANIELPTAENGAPLEDTPIVRIEKGYFFINDQMVRTQDLGQKLFELKKQSGKEDLSLLVQADQGMDFKELDPLLRASSEAKIQKLKFATTPAILKNTK